MKNGRPKKKKKRKMEDLATVSIVPKVSSDPNQQHLLGLECLLKVPHTPASYSPSNLDAFTFDFIILHTILMAIRII